MYQKVEELSCIISSKKNLFFIYTRVKMMVKKKEEKDRNRNMNDHCFRKKRKREGERKYFLFY